MHFPIKITFKLIAGWEGTGQNPFNRSINNLYFYQAEVHIKYTEHYIVNINGFMYKTITFNSNFIPLHMQLKKPVFSMFEQYSGWRNASLYNLYISNAYFVGKQAQSSHLLVIIYFLVTVKIEGCIWMMGPYGEHNYWRF